MISFEKRLRDEVACSIDDIAASAAKKPNLAASQFIDLVLRLLKEVGAKNSKAEILTAVGSVYDDTIAKIDLPGEIDPILHALLRQIVLVAVGIAYDRIAAE